MVDLFEFALHIEHGWHGFLVRLESANAKHSLTCIFVSPAELENATAGGGRYPLHEGYLHVGGRIMAAMARLANRCFCPQGATTIGVGREAEPLPEDDRCSRPRRGELCRFVSKVTIATYQVRNNGRS